VTTAVQLTLPEGSPWRAQEPTTASEQLVLRAFQNRPGVLMRADLCDCTGLTDRDVREAIDGLRGLGWGIIPAKPRGYRLAENPEDVRAFAQQQRRRAITIMVGARRMLVAIQRVAA
jgi:biotin operon repressor